ncbi:hypothetical protein I5J50_gp83 [Mycobacterium phage Purky]|uniref:Uncharacterized protein n=1 Tax=Mycobacterium phage Purky TaxID=2593351 RepID=A0A514TWW5_9CAUD|nr:hypothetical protein [Mycolicibacterium goodii]YP_009965206.1 hypothetical protein I5J50_gp83 [Mycobacterium phage Purky]MBU8833612.1 hypothetical protein [Mycolicibacterium goodii]QDK01186.1 hypothetical protein SEA_PURKY_83 [Mycobacterium phage Purky]
MNNPDPHQLAQELINSRPQLPPQMLGHLPVPSDRAAAIALMPAETKLRVSEMIIERMAKAYGLNIEIQRSADALDIRIEPPK